MGRRGRSRHGRSSEQCRWSDFFTVIPPTLTRGGQLGFAADFPKPASSRGKMSELNTVGRTVNMIDCRRWWPILSNVELLQSLPSVPSMPRLWPRKLPRRFRSFFWQRSRPDRYRSQSRPARQYHTGDPIHRRAIGEAIRTAPRACSQRPLQSGCSLTRIIRIRIPTSKNCRCWRRPAAGWCMSSMYATSRNWTLRKIVAMKQPKTFWVRNCGQSSMLPAPRLITALPRKSDSAWSAVRAGGAQLAHLQAPHELG